MDLIVGISLYLCFIRVSSFMWKIIDVLFKKFKRPERLRICLIWLDRD